MEALNCKILKKNLIRLLDVVFLISISFICIISMKPQRRIPIQFIRKPTDKATTITDRSRKLSEIHHIHDNQMLILHNKMNVVPRISDLIYTIRILVHRRARILF